MPQNNTIVLNSVNSSSTNVVCLLSAFKLQFDVMKYGERLRAARIHKGLTQEELVKLTGVKQGTISKIERGDQNSSGYDAILAHYLDVEAMWLTAGDDLFAPEWLPGTSKHHISESNAEYAPQLIQPSLVPVVGSAQLGDNGNWNELDYPVGHGDGYINYPTKDKNAYALRCKGDSMKPRIKDGEFVIVEPNSEYVPGDEVLLKSIDGRVMVKTYLYHRDGRVHLMSINEDHPPQSFALEEIDKIHPIAAIVKKGHWIKNLE